MFLQRATFLPESVLAEGIVNFIKINADLFIDSSLF